MAWSRSWFDLHPWRLIGQQLSVLCVETKNHYLVGSEIARVCKSAGGIKHDAMCMRALLTFTVYARALILLRVRVLAQTAVAPNGENRKIASRVIRDQDKFAGGIHIYITRICTQRCLLIQQPQPSGLLIDGKGADGAAFSTGEVVDFVDRIQITPVGCKS